MADEAEAKTALDRLNALKMAHRFQEYTERCETGNRKEGGGHVTRS